MKILTNLNMRTISAIAASSEAVGYPATNLLTYDPDVIWKAAAFTGTVTLTIDLGAAGSIDYIWLNNANFLNATLQANSSAAWDDPPVSKSVVLAEDDIGTIKGFFDLTETNYRYIRISIPVQTLLSGTVPELGNVILGDVQDLFIGSWAPSVVQEFNAFTSDGGSYSKAEKGKARHVFGAAIGSITKAELDALPLKGWSQAVIYTELGSVADSFLVYPPAGKSPRVRSPIDCDLEITLEECV